MPPRKLSGSTPAAIPEKKTEKPNEPIKMEQDKPKLEGKEVKPKPEGKEDKSKLVPAEQSKEDEKAETDDDSNVIVEQLEQKMAVKEGKKEKEEARATGTGKQQMMNVAAAIGTFSKTVISKARESLYAPVANYSTTDDVSIPDLFTSFGGQAALTRLQLQSSEAARAYKKHLKSLKPGQSQNITKLGKQVEALFEPEHLMESVELIDRSRAEAFKQEEIGECVGREKKTSALYARQHFAHLTALACQAIDPHDPQEECFKFITSIISELQLMLAQYEEKVSQKDTSGLLVDANECIKLLTEAAYQLVPIYKHSLINSSS